MEYRRLGSSDLHVSEIALGSWLTFGGGVERERAVACIDRAFELGINFIDTANVYGRGAAEELLGEVLRTRPRDSYVLATKLYFPMGDGDRGLSRAQILKQIDASLRRLQTDYVDLYQCHRYDQATPLEETMEALTEVVRGRQGPLPRVQRVVGRADRGRATRCPGVERFVSSQPQYSLLWRAARARGHPACAANGISQIVWSPLAQGVLTGKYRRRRGAARPTRAPSSDQMGWAMGRFLTDEIFAAVERLRPIAERCRHHAVAARARLGAARAERRGGDRRRLAARAARRERRQPPGVEPRRGDAGRDRRGARGRRRRSRLRRVKGAFSPHRRLAEGLPGTP